MLFIYTLVLAESNVANAIALAVGICAARRRLPSNPMRHGPCLTWYHSPNTWESMMATWPQMKTIIFVSKLHFFYTKMYSICRINDSEKVDWDWKFYETNNRMINGFLNSKMSNYWISTIDWRLFLGSSLNSSDLKHKLLHYARLGLSWIEIAQLPFERSDLTYIQCKQEISIYVTTWFQLKFQSRDGHSFPS